MKLRPASDEVLPAKYFARDLAGALDRVQSGDIDHLVITRYGTYHGVLLSVERYEQLLSGGARARPASDELLPAKSFARDLAGALDRVQSGTVDQLVITRHGAFHGVLLSVERYEKLPGHEARDAERELSRDAAATYA
jgi:PHD/YefM family antitoxin component YafN of YafNO toxin-antitoxin module